MKYADKKISEFIEQLSSQTPVPGGGSAAALVGAFGAALLCMVARFAQARQKKGIPGKNVLKVLLDACRIRDRLVRLVDEDIESYLEFSRAQRSLRLLTKRKSKKKLLKGALRKALASSLNICKASHRGLLISRKLIRIGNESLQSDVKAAILFLSASFHASLLMSEANLRLLKDGTVGKRTRKILFPMRREVARIVEDVKKEKGLG